MNLPNLGPIFRAGGRPVCFIHFPSCGGTTFWSVLRMAYGEHRVARFRDVGGRQKEFFETDFRRERRYRRRAIGGHVFFALAAEHCPDRAFVTFLRDPVARALSVYSRNVRNGNWQPDPARGAMDAVDYWRQKKLHSHTQGYYAPTVDQAFAHASGGGATPCTVDEAVETLLTRFDAVGLMEEFDASLHLIADALDWPKVPVYLQRNIGGNKPRDIDPEVRAGLEEILQFDRAVFDRVAKEVRARIAAHPVASDRAALAAYRAKLAQRRERLMARTRGKNPYLKTGGK